MLFSRLFLELCLALRLFWLATVSWCLVFARCDVALACLLLCCFLRFRCSWFCLSRTWLLSPVWVEGYLFFPQKKYCGSAFRLLAVRRASAGALAAAGFRVRARALVELLEEKGILTQEEYEKRIMEKVKVK
jgi:hypothetical protein